MITKLLLSCLSVSLLSVGVNLAQAPTLGTAATFALFTANGAFSNTGASSITGDIGTDAGALTGFPPGVVSGQIRLPGSIEADQAAADVVAAYSMLSQITCTTTITAELGGQTLAPGVYCQPAPDATSLNGTLTLSGAGVFIIKLNSALTTATNSTISLINGASACDVYFQVNGAVDLGTGSAFRGTILAAGAISLGTNASLEGRGLSTAGAISLNNNAVAVTNSILSINVMAGACSPATNLYSISGTISSTNAPASTVTVTDGVASTSVAIAAGETSTPYSLTGLISGTGSHTVKVSCAGNIDSVTYVAPASCTTATASLGGMVYSDNNGNGVSDGGDTAIVGATATLLNSTGEPITSTTTGGTGQYSFPDLTPGVAYSVSFTTPPGFSATTPTVSGPVTLSAGENNTSLSAGFRPVSPTIVSVTVSPGLTDSITNQYTLTGVITLTDAPSGSLTVTDGDVSTTIPIAAGQTSAAFSLPGLPSNTGSRTVVVSGSGYTPFSASYVAPASIVPANPSLSLKKYVSASKAVVGDVLMYTIIVTNSGTTAMNTIVRDSISAGGTYVLNSATIPQGTSFTTGEPISLWTIPSIAAGDSLTLTFMVTVNSVGVLYNVATVPGDTAITCTSIPVKLCAGDGYELTAPAGRASYRWYRNNILLTDQTSNMLLVSQAGSYTLGVDDANGLCPNFSCCPFIVEEDTLPAYQVAAIGATCSGSSAQNDGQLVLSSFAPGYTYQYSLGVSFDTTASLSGSPQTIPINGVISTILPNSVASQSYTVRVYNLAGCFVDQTVTIAPTVCACPADICVPFTLSKTRQLPLK